MAADMTTTNLRIRLYDAVGGDPDVAQAVWEIVSPVVAEGDVLKAAVADALVLLTGDQIGNPVLPEVRAQIIAQLETALDASSAPESTGELCRCGNPDNCSCAPESPQEADHA